MILLNTISESRLKISWNTWNLILRELMDMLIEFAWSFTKNFIEQNLSNLCTMCRDQMDYWLTYDNDHWERTVLTSKYSILSILS